MKEERWQRHSRKRSQACVLAAYTCTIRNKQQILASVGRNDRSDEKRQRFATVEFRVGDYPRQTHTIEGRAASPRASPRRAAQVRHESRFASSVARHGRSDQQATEALTRVRTNVAAKVQDENPAPDFSREEKHEHSGSTVSYSLDTRAWEAKLRRVSAVFSEDPLVLRSQVSLTVEADNRYYVNSEGSQIVTGDVGGRIFIQGVTKAEDGMELPLYTSYFATSPDGLRTSAARRGSRGRSNARRLRKARSSSRSRARQLSGRGGVFFHEISAIVEGNRHATMTTDGLYEQRRIPVLRAAQCDVRSAVRKPNVEMMGITSTTIRA